MAEEEGFVLLTPTENNQVIDFRLATNAKNAENAIRGHNLGTRKSCCIVDALTPERSAANAGFGWATGVR